MTKKTQILILLAAVTVLVLIGVYQRRSPGPVEISHDRGRVTITDQRGERWDITEAAALGFQPEKFRYGIGRHAFAVLDDSHLQQSIHGPAAGTRILGIADGREARAFSLTKMTEHEIVNSTLDGRPLAATY